MKIWILRPIDVYADNSPWEPWFDKAFGFIIAADTDLNARLIADSEAGDENRGNNHPWLNIKLSTCKELNSDDYVKDVIIMQDFHAA